MPSTTTAKSIRKTVDMVIAGNTQESIAKTLGVSQPAISKALKRPEVRTLLERTFIDIASLAPHVHRVYKEEIEQPLTPDTSIDARKLRVTVAGKIADAIGLSPVRDSMNNPFFVQIIQPTQINLSVPVQNALTRISGTAPAIAAPSRDAPDYTDAELIDDDQ